MESVCWAQLIIYPKVLCTTLIKEKLGSNLVDNWHIEGLHIIMSTSNCFEYKDTTIVISFTRESQPLYNPACFFYIFFNSEWPTRIELCQELFNWYIFLTLKEVVCIKEHSISWCSIMLVMNDPLLIKMSLLWLRRI